VEVDDRSGGTVLLPAPHRSSAARSCHLPAHQPASGECTAGSSARHASHDCHPGCSTTSCRSSSAPAFATGTEILTETGS
jgi:hypothetical protein